MKLVSKQNVKRYGVGAVLSTALVAPAFAAEGDSALNVTDALQNSNVTAEIGTAATWVLGVVLVIYAARKVIGFFGR